MGCGQAPQSGGPPERATARLAAHELTDRTVALQAGWNALGLRCQRVTAVSTNSQIAGMATFSGRQYEFHNLSAFDLNQGEGGRRGFWLYCTAATSLTYSGGDDSRGAYINLQNGWNLVSLGGDSDLSGPDLLALVDGQAVPVGSRVLPDVYELGEGNRTTVVNLLTGTLRAGRAYWMFANGSVQLRLPAGQGPPVLRFLQQPGGVEAATSFEVRVEAIDAEGKRDLARTGKVTLSLGAGRGPLYGTLTAPLSAGWARFESVQVGAAHPSARLRATLGDRSVLSDDFRVAPEIINRESQQFGAAGPVFSRGHLSHPGRSLSRDGRYAIFVADDQVFRRDRLSGLTERVTEHNGNPHAGLLGDPTAAISADGRYVAFISKDTFGSFVTHHYRQVYLRDMQAPGLRLISGKLSSATEGSTGDAAFPNVSELGEFVTYSSAARDLSGAATSGASRQVYRYRSATGSTELVSQRLLAGRTAGGSTAATEPSISDDGQKIAFLGAAGSDLLLPASARNQAYLRDFSAGTLDLLSRRAGGGPSESEVSSVVLAPDGQSAVLTSGASDLTEPPTTPAARSHVFSRNLLTGEMTLVSRRVGGSAHESTAKDALRGWPSSDGRFVVFESWGGDLVAGAGFSQGQIFIRDLATGETGVASRAAGGRPSPSTCYFPCVSGDGGLVLFESFYIYLTIP